MTFKVETYTATLTDGTTEEGYTRRTLRELGSAIRELMGDDHELQAYVSGAYYEAIQPVIIAYRHNPADFRNLAILAASGEDYSTETTTEWVDGKLLNPDGTLNVHTVWESCFVSLDDCGNVKPLPPELTADALATGVVTLKDYTGRIATLARIEDENNDDLTVWNESWFTDDSGRPIDPFWSDSDDVDTVAVVHDDSTDNLVVFGVSWYMMEHEGAEGPYVFARILRPWVESDGDMRKIRCGDDITRTFRMEDEEDAYTDYFTPSKPINEGAEREYGLYEAGEDYPPADVWFARVIELLQR